MPDVTHDPFPKKGPSLLSRREFIGTAMGLAVGGALVSFGAAQLVPGLAPKPKGAGGASPVIRRDPATNAKIPVTLDDLKAQPQNLPFTGEWNFLPAVIYMVKQDILKASAKVQGYNTAQYAVAHPTQADYAIMVYSGKCKHLGCTVGWNGALGAAKPEVGREDYDRDGLNDGRILCPCHQGQYDIHNLARNQPGTPPPAPLDVIQFNIAPSYTDPEGKIASGSNVIMAAQLIPQLKYLDANKDPQKEFALGTMAAKVAA